MCLDVLVELLYVDDGKESLNLSETGHDVAILADLVASGEAYTVVSAVELSWVLSPNRQLVSQLVEK